MSRKQREPGPDEHDVTEIEEAHFTKVAGVASPANRVPFVMLKSREGTPPPPAMVRDLRAGRLPSLAGPVAKKKKPSPRLSYLQVPGPADEERVAEEKEAAERAKKLARKAAKKQAAAKRAKRVRKAVVRASVQRAVRTAWKAAEMQSNEIPALGPSEADSILAAVTGERGSICGRPTADGTPCMRPSVAGLPCHHHN